MSMETESVCGNVCFTDCWTTLVISVLVPGGCMQCIITDSVWWREHLQMTPQGSRCWCQWCRAPPADWSLFSGTGNLSRSLSGLRRQTAQACVDKKKASQEIKYQINESQKTFLCWQIASSPILPKFRYSYKEISLKWYLVFLFQAVVILFERQKQDTG